MIAGNWAIKSQVSNIILSPGNVVAAFSTNARLAPNNSQTERRQKQPVEKRRPRNRGSRRVFLTKGQRHVMHDAIEDRRQDRQQNRQEQ